MAEKNMKAVLRLRRDNSINYEKKQSFIPLDGEVCLVDTLREGLRVKIGDGVAQYKALPYVDFGIVLRGYYYNDAFYADVQHTQVLDNTATIYIDEGTRKAYYYDDNHFVQINGVPNASAVEAGIAKLYDTWDGTNEDGSVTQKALRNKFVTIDDRLNAIKQQLDNQKIILDPNNVSDEELVEFSGFNIEVLG